MISCWTCRARRERLFVRFCNISEITCTVPRGCAPPASDQVSCMHKCPGNMISWLGSPCHRHPPAKPSTFIPLLEQLAHSGSPSQAEQGLAPCSSCQGCFGPTPPLLLQARQFALMGSGSCQPGLESEGLLPSWDVELVMPLPSSQWDSPEPVVQAFSC